MAHDNLEDLLWEAERLGVRKEVLKKASKIKQKTNKPSRDIYDDAFDKVKKKLNKKRRTSK